MSLLTASEILGEQGIRMVRGVRSGNTKTLCPRCSHTRKNKRDPCLSVLVDTEGVQYFCHNCGFHGGKFYDAKRTDKPVWRGQKQPFTRGREIASYYR